MPKNGYSQDSVSKGFIYSSITYRGCKIRKEVNIPVIAVNEILTEEKVRS